MASLAPWDLSGLMRIYLILVEGDKDMASGMVKSFNDAKGCDLATLDDGTEDLFAHFWAINMSGFKPLKEGQKVTFDIVNGPKSKQASNI